MLPRLSPIDYVRGLWRIVTRRPEPPASLADNPLLRILLDRRSVRSFTPDDLPADVLAAILEAGRLAPSTVNLQTWSFAVFRRTEWQAAFGRTIPFRAPAAVIVLADTCRDRASLDVFLESPLVEYTVAVMNASLAAMAMNVAAEALGVSSVMLSETGRSGFLDAAYLRRTLALPPHVVPLMTIVFGYARGARPPMPPKLPLDAITFTGPYRPTEPVVMEDWLKQMMAGYKASHPGSSFENQLALYRSKLVQAEADLQELVLGQRR